jgi:hypothetical protein
MNMYSSTTRGGFMDRVDDILIYSSSIYFHQLGIYGFVVRLSRKGGGTVFEKSP